MRSHGSRTARTTATLHVVHVTAPAAFGGAERVLAGLLPALVARGVKVSCIAVLTPGSDEPPFLEGLRRAGVRVVILRLQAREYARERREVLAQLRELGATVTHTHGYRSDALIGPAARGAGYPVVTTMHGFTRQGWRGRLYEWLQLRAVRRFDAVVAVSNPMVEELVRRGVPRRRIRLIQNGLSGDASTLLSREAARAALGLPLDAPIVGWVGRLSEEKDPALAVQALATLDDPRVLLAVVGDGPLAGALRDTAVRLGVGDRLRALGAVAEAGRYFRAFDALLLSSRTEGTPMAILEAALARVPVVATAVGGVPDLLGADSPQLAAHGDAAGLARALDGLLADPATAMREGSALEARIRAGAGGDWIEAYRQLYATGVTSSS